MSYRRIFSLREFALCLVILANAIGLGVVILTTAVSASSTLEKVAAESSENAPALEVELVDQGKVGSDDVDAAVDTTTPAIEALPELSSGGAVVNEQVSVQAVEAPATTVVPITEESSSELPVVDTDVGSLLRTPDGGDKVPSPETGPETNEPGTHASSPSATHQLESSPVSTTGSGDPVVEQTPLEIAQELLKADYEELMDSGLDFSSAIKELDLMAEEERYGEFGKR
jgi:hypothetical protein